MITFATNPWVWIVTCIVLLWLAGKVDAWSRPGDSESSARVYNNKGVLIVLKRMRKFVITDPEGVPYMTRWVLFSCKWGELKLHHFHRSDADRDLHDHPWDFWSLMLWGGYWEETTVETYQCLPRKSHIIHPLPSTYPLPDRIQAWYRPGRLLHRKAEHAHRVVLQEHYVYDGEARAPHTVRIQKAWTLIWSEFPRRKWGFHTICGWQYWKPYLAKKFAKTPICE